jgi:hypothetical protein
MVLSQGNESSIPSMADLEQVTNCTLFARVLFETPAFFLLFVHHACFSPSRHSHRG